MIFLTRLDGREVVVNTDLVVTVERIPDTVVTLTTGDRIMVREPVEEVVERAVAFRHRVLQGPGALPPALQSRPAFVERSRLGTPPPVSGAPPAGGQVSGASADVSGQAPPTGKP